MDDTGGVDARSYLHWDELDVELRLFGEELVSLADETWRHLVRRDCGAGGAILDTHYHNMPGECIQSAIHLERVVSRGIHELGYSLHRHVDVAREPNRAAPVSGDDLDVGQEGIDLGVGEGFMLLRAYWLCDGLLCPLDDVEVGVDIGQPGICHRVG